MFGEMKGQGQGGQEFKPRQWQVIITRESKGKRDKTSSKEIFVIPSFDCWFAFSTVL